MTQKFLYIVDHAIQFPASEYGGIWNVIAENDDECFDLISSSVSYRGYEKYFPLLRENIIKADKYSLLEEEDSRIVAEFTT